MDVSSQLEHTKRDTGSMNLYDQTNIEISKSARVAHSCDPADAVEKTYQYHRCPVKMKSRYSR